MLKVLKKSDIKILGDKKDTYQRKLAANRGTNKNNMNKLK